VDNTPVPILTRQSDDRLVDFDALLQIALTGDSPASTADVYGNSRPGNGEPGFPKTRGCGRIFRHTLQVPDFLAPRLTVPANFSYRTMAVQEEGSSTLSALALRSEIQWCASTGISECTRTCYIIRPAPQAPTGYTVTVYWWQLSQRHVGETFGERLEDEHRKAYFSLVVSDLVASGDPMFAMLSPRPCPEANPDILSIMRRQFERDLAQG